MQPWMRNIPAISPEEQRRLSSARVCVVGCGGIGGYLVEYLTRLGVGRLTVIDGDSFEISNLNRQVLSSVRTLGQSKALTAARRAAEISPEADVQAKTLYLNGQNACDLIRGSDVVMDALDGIPARLTLASACRSLGIPLIHGSVQGWTAQIAVCMPAGRTMEQIYGHAPASGDNSCLSFTAAFCASVQCAEALKLLTGREATLESSLMTVDLRDMSVSLIPMN